MKMLIFPLLAVICACSISSLVSVHYYKESQERKQSLYTPFNSNCDLKPTTNTVIMTLGNTPMTYMGSNVFVTTLNEYQYKNIEGLIPTGKILYMKTEIEFPLEVAYENGMRVYRAGKLKQPMLFLSATGATKNTP